MTLRAVQLSRVSVPVVPVVLVVCFFVQTAFVYFDFPSRASARELSDDAKVGLALWRKHNCQVCHQIHGFGGFLGPDLTNIVARRPSEDWSDVLTRGRKQMPAFEFDEKEQAAIVAFLTDLNETGTSIPRFATVRPGTDANYMVERYATATGEVVEAAVLRGEREMRENGCNSCHVAFGVGVQGSPDLTISLSLWSPAYIRRILLESKGNMPAHDFLTSAQLDDMLACMRWMNRNREALGRFHSTLDNGQTFSWKAVPWFEY